MGIAEWAILGVAGGEMLTTAMPSGVGRVRASGKSLPVVPRGGPSGVEWLTCIFAILCALIEENESGRNSARHGAQ